MKFSDVMKVWEILHVKNTGDIGFCDLNEAIKEVVGMENDTPGCLEVTPSKPEKKE